MNQEAWRSATLSLLVPVVMRSPCDDDVEGVVELRLDDIHHLATVFPRLVPLTAVPETRDGDSEVTMCFAFEVAEVLVDELEVLALQPRPYQLFFRGKRRQSGDAVFQC